MKLEIIDKEVKAWGPLKVTITLDSVEEARLLFHCFNKKDLKDAILGNRYNNQICNSLHNDGEELRKAIISRGYTV